MEPSTPSDCDTDAETPADDCPDPRDGEDMFERAMRRKYPILRDSRF
jgi:hypothetical protein